MAARLGGTCGIPWERDRVYVEVSAVVDAAGCVRPREIRWGDGRRFPVTSCLSGQSWGRWEAGNLVAVWDVELGRGSWRRLFWERGRFFVRRRDANGEPNLPHTSPLPART